MVDHSFRLGDHGRYLISQNVRTPPINEVANYVVVDLEATCWEGSKTPEMEIIEIGAVYLDGSHLQEVKDFGQFVRPIENPTLTDFCTNLTTITQSRIDNAPAFSDAFAAWMDWIGGSKFKLVSWGEFDYDLIVAECRRHHVQLPSNFVNHINLKPLFASVHSTKSSIGFREALGKLKMRFEGTLHRGIDDARNIAKVAKTLLILDQT